MTLGDLTPQLRKHGICLLFVKRGQSHRRGGERGAPDVVERRRLYVTNFLEGPRQVGSHISPGPRISGLLLQPQELGCVGKAAI